MAETLNELREAVLAIDKEILELLNKRAGCAIKIGELKAAQGLAVYDPGRERELIACLEKANGGPLPSSALRQIYREIFSVSRSLQKPIAVAYLGPEASFTHQAMRSHFGGSVAPSAQPTVFDVFEAVEKGRADFGVVPVENSLEGSVKQTLDKLVSTPLSIVGDIYLPISHCLLSADGNIDQVKRVHSHPQALAQCSRWLRSNLPAASLHEEESTASAARRVLEDRQAAAVGSKAAAATYGLIVIAEGIEDHSPNVTRFLIIGKRINKPSGRDKTSILFGVRHEPGALFRSLAPFGERGINLTKIVSHPLRERIWEYLFFVDFIGHAGDAATAGCLAELEKTCTFVKILGSYPLGEKEP